MEVLEIAPLRDRSLTVYLVEKEYEEEWKLNNNHNHHLNILSREYCIFIKGQVTNFKPDFVVEELGLRSKEGFRSQLAEYIDMPVYPVDLPDYAKNYIEVEVNDKLDALNQINVRLRTLEFDPKQLVSSTTLPWSRIVFQSTPKEFDPQQLESDMGRTLLTCSRYLEEEVRQEEETIRTSVREAWMIKQILDYARNIKKSNVKCLFICSLYHFEGLIGLFTKFKIEEKVKKYEKIPSQQLQQLESYPLSIKIS